MKFPWAVSLLTGALVACAQAPRPPVEGASGPCPQPAPATNAQALGTPAPEARGVIVKFSSAGAPSGVRALGLREQDGALAWLDAADPQATAKALRARPGVVYAVPNVILHALGEPVVTPSDEYAPLQWTYPLLGYGAVWRDMQGAPYTRAVTLAVLDSGVRYDHPDLAGALWRPGEGALDLVPCPAQAGDPGDADGMDQDPTDPAFPGRTEGSHGTHVTGIIAARWGKFPAPCSGCSDSGVAGAVWNAPVKVLPIRVLDAHGDGDLWSVMQGLRYAAGQPISFGGKTYTNPHPAQVINLSLGNPIGAQEAAPLCEAAATATRAGSLVVAAAGNDAGGVPFYPGACDGVVAVASVSLGQDGVPEHAPYSNAYPQVALAAPGGDSQNAYNGATLNGKPFPDAVFSTSWDYAKNQPNYVAMEGTSQAAPQVSALAALLLSKGVVATPAQALARMEATARDLGPAGRDSQFGFGLIDAAAALNAR